jgi:hypothetical protein
MNSVKRVLYRPTGLFFRLLLLKSCKMLNYNNFNLKHGFTVVFKNCKLQYTIIWWPNANNCPIKTCLSKVFVFRPGVYVL